MCIMGETLTPIGRVVFSKRAALRTAVGAHDAGGHDRMRDGRREAGAVDGGGGPVDPGEAGGERADALQADAEADVGDRTVRDPEERGGALEPAGEQVLVRRLAERAPELAAE